MTQLDTSTKQAILDMIQRMPDDCSVEDVMYALYVRKVIARGLADEAAGRLIPNEEVMKQLDEWLQSPGQ